MKIFKIKKNRKSIWWKCAYDWRKYYILYGWAELQKINLIHFGSVLNVNVEQYDSNDLVYMKYAPITSVDVERSFTMYKNILAPNRMSFDESNLTKYMVVNSFFNI